MMPLDDCDHAVDADADTISDGYEDAIATEDNWNAHSRHECALHSPRAHVRNHGQLPGEAFAGDFSVPTHSQRQGAFHPEQVAVVTLSLIIITVINVAKIAALAAI